MGKDHVGEWTARFPKLVAQNASVPLGKWHLIESDVADRKVVKCGKELRDITTAGELRFRAASPYVFTACIPCSGK